MDLWKLRQQSVRQTFPFVRHYLCHWDQSSPSDRSYQRRECGPRTADQGQRQLLANFEVVVHEVTLFPV